MPRLVHVPLIRCLLFAAALVGGCAQSATAGSWLPAPHPPRAVEQLIPDAALDLMVAFEVVSPDYYARHLQACVWPGHASGLTCGIGYDLGFHSAAVIALDWQAHPAHDRLAAQAGINGSAAAARVSTLADVRIGFKLARRVFDQSTIVVSYRQMLRAFPGAERLAPIAQGMLVSLVYNRGGSMMGDSRSEMRAIRDICVPASDYLCMARQLRAMVRVWRGSTIERGMARRRYAEADLLASIR